MAQVPTPTPKSNALMAGIRNKWTTIVGVLIIGASVMQFVATQKPPQSLQDWIQLLVGAGMILAKDGQTGSMP